MPTEAKSLIVIWLFYASSEIKFFPQEIAIVVIKQLRLVFLFLVY